MTKFYVKMQILHLVIIETSVSSIMQSEQMNIKI